jgi:glycosyltransferase involved in cell wall biosynthesis
MEKSGTTVLPGNESGEPPLRWLAEFEKARREEIERLRIQHLERFRQLESGRLRAEEERDAQEEKFAALDEQYRRETARLNDALSRLGEEKRLALDARADLDARLARAEASRDSLDREKREWLERWREERARAAEERERLEKEKKALKEGIRASKENEAFYRQGMIVAERRLHAVERGFSRRIGQAVLRGFSGWRGLASLPAAVWAACRASLSGRGDSEAWLKQVEKTFAAKGRDAAEDFIRAGADDPADLAAGLTRLARLTVGKDPAAALSLGREATRIDPRPFRRKWLAFLLFDAGHIDAAQDLLASLHESADFKPSEKNKAACVAGCHRLRHGAFPLPAAEILPGHAPEAGRVLYVAASSLPFHTTGYTLRTHGLLKALRQQGVEISCVTRPGYPADRTDASQSGGTEAGARSIDGVRYEILPGPHRRKAGLDRYLLESAEILAEKAMAEKAALIHAASNHEAALPALMAARRLGIPFVYEVRGLWEYTTASKKAAWEHSERFALESRLEALAAQNADQVLTLTGALAGELCSRGVPRAKITLAPNAIDVDAFVPMERNASLAAKLGIGEDDFVVGYAGAIVAYEGLDDLIEAAALLLPRLPKIRVLIAGGGDALPELVRLAEARGLAGRVVFPGKLSPEAVREHYSLLDAIALPRKPETVCQLVSPLKPLEAMAMGIPLVVSDVAALREMVADGETALVHFAGNARSLADAIELLAKKPELRRRLAENARRHVATRTWKQGAENIAAIYRDLFRENAAWREARRAESALAAASTEPIPIPLAPGKNSLSEPEKTALDQKLAQATAQGVEVLRRFLAAQCEGRSGKFAAFCRLRAARACLGSGEDAEAMKIAEDALREETSAATLRGAARLFYDAANLARALELARQLEESLGQVKPNDRKFIDEIRRRAQLLEWAALPAQARTLPARPKRVLNLLAFSLPHASVGYATRSHGLARGIRNAGWDIRPCTRPGFPFDFKPELAGQTLPEQDEIDGIVYRRLFGDGRGKSGEAAYLHASIGHYERLIREEEPEIVHAASNYVTALPALIAARRLGVPFVYEVRGFWEMTRSSQDECFRNTPKYRYMQLFEGVTARHADRVITITPAMKEQLMARGVPEARIAIAWNGVDPERFAPRTPHRELATALGLPDGVPVIGYVGSFVDYEGLDDLVAACAGLAADGLDFRLLLVGDGAAFEDLKRQVEASGLHDKTVMTGRVPFEQVEDYYSLIDIAPFPRKPWEICEIVSPLKPYEAMAQEKAVVVSGTRALQEIVTHGENGLVFAKGEVGDLKMKLQELVTNPAYREALGRKARTWVCEERSWDAAGRVCCETYECIKALKDERGHA